MPDYWSYWQSGEGDWAYAVSGSEASAVRDGAIEAWSWGEGTPPALLTFTQVCQPGSLQPASVAIQSQSAAPTAYPEPAAEYSRPPTTAVQSYPAPAATQPPAEPTPYPQPAAESAAPAEAPALTKALAPAAPYLILLVLVAGLFLGVLTLARRKK